MNQPAALIILDGFAEREEKFGNAIAHAEMPNYKRYKEEYPSASLNACGLDVGLPEGQMGNSEVGHLNIGAGRVVYQSLTRINKSIEDGEFHKNEVLLSALKHAKSNNSKLHIMGLLSDGGVHSHYTHLFEVLKMAEVNDFSNVYVHGFLDGRDVNKASALTYIEEAERQFADIGIGSFATISGRYYAMDRDKRWERAQLAYDALVQGKGTVFPTAAAGVEASYADEIFDEFVEPFIVNKSGVVGNNDAVIFINFRPDRASQLSEAFTDPAFKGFDCGKAIDNLKFVTFTKYSEAVRADVVFEKMNLGNTLGQIVSEAGKTQLRIAETEKYPHVTYFMNGGRHDEFEGESRILVNSPKVATYDLKPEMSAYEVTDQLLGALDDAPLDMIILNFANPDMVGHSGMLEPTVKALEAVDECLGKVVDKIISQGGTAIITADHGNADEVLTITGDPMTAHTVNPVPVIVTDKSVSLREGGRLSDLAPTMLEIMMIKQPEDMTGKSLLI